MPISSDMPFARTSSATRAYSSSDGSPLWSMSERISTLSRFPLVADRYCSAISSELISELYVSLTILQPFMPSLSSSRMATLCSRDSRFRIGSVSKPSAPYSASASAAFAREAGSSNGSPSSSRSAGSTPISFRSS